jgi:prepilin-type N-terminal cleavage/methylation domain-containing protein
VSRANRRAQSANQGFTVIELLITVLLVSILLGAIWMVYSVGFKTFYTQWTRTGIKGQAGRTFINIAGELRQATSVTVAQQANLNFSADTDNNGIDETIQYIWSGVAGGPLQRISSVTMPVVDSVNSLAFSYYDANNNLLSFPVAPSQVRLVAIDIIVTDKEETFHLRSNMELRNL